MSVHQVGAVSLDVTVAAAADDERYLTWPFPGTWLVEYIAMAPATAVALDASNYWTTTISANDGAAGAFASIGAHNTTTGGDALVLGTTISVTPTAGADIELTQGDILKFAKVETGTGAAWDGAYTVYCRKLRV